MSEKKNILFLYFELSGYVLASLNNFVRSEEEYELHVIHYPVNPEAPFKFEPEDGLNLYDKAKLTEDACDELLTRLNPEAVLCSGWTDDYYKKVCKKYKGKIPTVLLMDNDWRGEWRQKLRMLLSPLTVTRYFTHAWVPGEPQVTYARKLGFKSDRIFKYFYVADLPTFNRYYYKTWDKKKEKLPHRFLYVGRYLSLKGIEEVWEAMQRIRAEGEQDWELWCAGGGELADEFPDHPAIRDFGFVQPNRMEQLIQGSTVVIQPSYSDHWAVNMQEFAICGFPMLASTRVVATTVFIEEGKNGFTFEPGDTDALVEKMKYMISKTDDELIQMGEHSHDLGNKVTHEMWNKTLIEIVESN